MPRGKRKKATVSKIGSYHCNFGNSKLHEWLIAQVEIKGCTSVPETIKRFLQEAFERQQQAGNSPA